MARSNSGERPGGNRRALVVHQGKRDEYQVAQALAESGWEVTLVTSAYGTPTVRAFARRLGLRGLSKLAARHCQALDGHRVVPVFWTEIASKLVEKFNESLALEWINWRISAAARALVRTGGFDLVVCYNYNAFITLNDESAQLPRTVVFQCHPHPLAVREVLRDAQRQGFSPESSGEREFSYSPSYQAMLISEPLLADEVWCASSFTLDSLRRAGVDERRIRVIPYGVSANGHSVERARRPDAEAPLKLLFVGQFVYRKGILALCEILNRLSFPVSITFVGRGIRECDPLERISNPLVTAEARWDVPGEELARIYREAEVFLFPSLVEGFAQVILEAMQFGCVPIVSTHSAGPDLIQQDTEGYFLSPFEIDRYVQCISELRDPDRLAAMAAATQRKAALFTWARFREQIGEAA